MCNVRLNVNGIKQLSMLVKVTNGKSSPEGHLLKEMMRKGLGAKLIREKLQNYVDALKTEYSQSIILPGKNDVKQPTQVRKWFLCKANKQSLPLNRV